MRNRFLLLSTFLLILILAACQSQPAVTEETVTAAGGSYININAEGLNTMMKEKDFVLVNVHIPYAGDIPYTDLSIPYNEITETSYLSQLPVDKDAKIVLYCRSGRMSQIASEELVALGYTNIWNFKNGMVEWEQAGFELDE
ncbi:MAG TPA: rhodanese-like domain-containing protein [Anaerolineales bacterium]|nr:rhodanese-like domain-containing protein [Anaerolineales bacterium]